MDVVEALAKKLREIDSIKPPAWVFFAKSGSHAERPPSDEGFWFKRCASVLIELYGHNVGVRRLRHKYGGRRQHVVHRSHHAPAGGKLIRVALQQLEKAGLAKKEKIGRSITPQGRSLVGKAIAAASV